MTCNVWIGQNNHTDSHRTLIPGETVEHGEIPDRGVCGYFVRDCICGQNWGVYLSSWLTRRVIFTGLTMSAEVVKVFLTQLLSFLSMN